MGFLGEAVLVTSCVTRDQEQGQKHALNGTGRAIEDGKNWKG